MSTVAAKDLERATIDTQCPKPVYPKGALRFGQEGAVALELLVGADGKVHESAVLVSSGYRALDSATQEGIGRCAFAPKVVSGKAVDSHLKYDYKWSIDGAVPGQHKPALPPTFEAAPPGLRAFLIDARKADTIVGPLKRCLAYPDLPDNTWRPGAVQAYCHQLFGNAITRKKAAALPLRSGGSFDAMRRYAVTLEPLVAARPLLAQVYRADDGSPYTARAKAYAEAIAVASKVALTAPYPDLLEMLGKHRANNGNDHWETLVVLLEASRFSNDDATSARERGRLLSYIGELDWALPSLQRAVALAPDEAHANFLLGILYFELREIELAVPYLVKGLGDTQGRRGALFRLYRIAAIEENIDKADEYSAQYVSEFPHDPDAWLARAYVKRKQGKESGAVDAYKKVLALNDGSDPGLQQGRIEAQRYIDGERK